MECDKNMNKSLNKNMKILIAGFFVLSMVLSSFLSVGAVNIKQEKTQDLELKEPNIYPSCQYDEITVEGKVYQGRTCLRTVDGVNIQLYARRCLYFKGELIAEDISDSEGSFRLEDVPWCESLIMTLSRSGYKTETFFYCMNVPAAQWGNGVYEYEALHIYKEDNGNDGGIKIKNLIPLESFNNFLNFLQIW